MAWKIYFAIMIIKIISINGIIRVFVKCADSVQKVQCNT